MRVEETAMRKPGWRRAGRVAAVAALAVVLLTAGGVRSALAQAASSRPNVLFIVSDDLNDDIGAWGHPIVQTPNLDRLAARGVRFVRAYTQYALCNPSRASFMTGLRPDTTGVYDLQTHFRANVPDVVTLPQMFRRAGYFAARVGKIYHYGVPSDIGTSGLDDPASWDTVVNPHGVDKDEEEPRVTFAGPSRGLGASLGYYASPAPDEAHTDGKVATEAIRLMEEHREGPFFLAVGFYRPHCPYIAPQKYFDLYPSLDDIPVAEYSELLIRQSPTASHGVVWNVPEQEQREAIRAYYAAISFMDAQVGRVLGALDRLGLRDNTVVVFMSDHGYHLGDHGGLWMKQSLFERSTRTPLMFAGPGVSAAGQASSRIVELVDIYPTLAALTGVAPPAGLQGRSFAPLLRDPAASWHFAALSEVRRPLTRLGAASPRGGGRGAPGRAGSAGRRGGAARGGGAPVDEGYSIRTELYRYTEWNDRAGGEELFDEVNDPGELRNLAGDAFYADVLQRMRARMHDLRTSTPARVAAGE
jgi:uncharacterized sulfatase